MRKRSRYKPRPVHLNAITRAMEGAGLIPAYLREPVEKAVITALDEFGRGIDCSDNWRVMADALNVAESLSDVGIASDDASRETISAAQRVLADVWNRREARGWTLYAAERKALDDGLWLHRVQLTLCSFNEYERALEATRRRVGQALAGNASARAIVVAGAIA